MLRIGYVRLSDDAPSRQADALQGVGCHVIRTEEVAARGLAAPVLASILDFIGEGDQLVIDRLDRLANGAQDLLDVMARLDERGATLFVAEGALSSQGEGGRTLRAVLQAVRALPAESQAQGRRGPAEAHHIRALKRAGVGPVEIARRLGVSRMTVWRKLREAEVQA